MSKDVKENGVVFTPSYICDFMLSFINKDKTELNNDISILEPSCGDGAFIKSLITEKYTNLHGNDINADFIEKCREKYQDVNFYNEDFVEFDILKKYDVIIGNPPYVRIQNLKKEMVSKIKKTYPELISGSLDLYVYFILKCVDMLSENGKLIFIIPNSFLFNKSCKKAREYLIQKRLLEYVIDFKEKKIFDGISVYTCIIVLNKKDSSTRSSYFYANEILLNNNYKNISYKEETSYTNSLLKYINVKNGIATLCDDVFIIKTINSEDDLFVYFTKNNTEYKIEKTILKKVLKVSKKQNYYIITPYKFINNKAIIMNDLNLFPECEKYLLENKNKLDNRDKGKKKYEKWYAFGRKQALDENFIERQFISTLVLDIKDSLFLSSTSFFYSGLILEIKKEYCHLISNNKLNEFLQENESSILKKANVKSHGWFCLSKSCFDIDASTFL